jgi:hypothetical protein
METIMSQICLQVHILFVNSQTSGIVGCKIYNSCWKCWKELTITKNVTAIQGCWFFLVYKSFKKMAIICYFWNTE